MAKFIVKSGVQAGREIAISGPRVLLGRGEDCDVVVSDVNVSRNHAQAVVINGSVSLYDLNSSNGTLVNGLPISRVVLLDGDEIRLGETILVFSDPDPGTTASRADWARASQFERTPAVAGDGLGAIEHTQLFEPISENAHIDALKEVYLKLKTVYRTFHEVAQSTNLKAVCEAIGRAVTLSTRVERLVVFLNAERSGGEWERYYVHTAPRLDARAASRPEQMTVVRRAAEDRHVIAANLDNGRLVFESGAANVLAIPIIRGGQVTAVLYADNPVAGDEVTKNDADLIATLALQLTIRLGQVEQVQQLKQENAQLRSKAEEEHAVIVQNQQMKQIMGATARVAESDSCVLVTGESGTGKELIARAIHNFSRRASRPLVAVNCAALHETLLESELFGHEKGAFTGAVERRIGKFELADGGTLFLDEIGDISAAAQAKLLRALQEGEIQRVGGNKTIKVNVRLIAATNKNLLEEVQKGNFRQDLFFRVKVIEMKLPPLRDRLDDVPPLAEYFLKQLRQKFPTPVKSIAPETMTLLMRYSYPGNIRELRNIIERGLVFANGEVLLPENLPSEVAQESPPEAAGGIAGILPMVTASGEPLSLADVEKQHIQMVLQHVRGNKLRAASILGISRTTLYEKLRAYGLAEAGA